MSKDRERQLANQLEFFTKHIEEELKAITTVKVTLPKGAFKELLIKTYLRGRGDRR